MDSILIISEEPSLLETLASELPGVAIEQIRFFEAAVRLHEASPHQKEPHLVVIDENENTSVNVDTGTIPTLRLVRPIRLSELLYTIRERLQGKSAPSREELPLSGGFRFSPSERLVRSVDGVTQITLTEKETELLQCLLAKAGQAIARDTLLKTVWGYNDDIATHTLETHIYRLRGKLRQTSDSLDILSSEEGGYLLKLG
jgi:two-component SAPR family response regulator